MFPCDHMCLLFLSNWFHVLLSTVWFCCPHSILLTTLHSTDCTPFYWPHSIPLTVLHSTDHTPFYWPYSILLTTLHSTNHTPFYGPHSIPLTTLHSTDHTPLFWPHSTLLSVFHSSSWPGPGLACESHWPKWAHAVMETTTGLPHLQSSTHLHCRVLIRERTLQVPLFFRLPLLTFTSSHDSVEVQSPTPTTTEPRDLVCRRWLHTQAITPQHLWLAVP